MRTWAKVRVPNTGIEYRIVEKNGRILLQLLWSTYDDSGRHEHRRTLSEHKTLADALNDMAVAVRVIGG